MKYHIAMLLKQHLIDYCQENIPDFSENFQIDYYSYEDLSELDNLYILLKDRYDGFVTSGIVPHHYLTEIAGEDDTSFACFRFDIENTYRILLQQCIRRSSADLSRVGIDFLGEGRSLARVVTEGDLPRAAVKFEHQVSVLTAQELADFEDRLNRSYLERYHQGELDLVVTYFYSTVQTFAGLPLDCYYLYPSENEFRYVMRSLEQHITQRKVKGSFPAMLRIDLTAEVSGNSDRTDLFVTDMQRVLLEFIDRFNNKLSLKAGTGYFELYTDSRTVDQLTGHFHTCSLMHHLREKLRFRGCIGYGIGADFYSARSNALKAVRFACQQADGQNGSYLIDQNQMLTCLADQGEPEEKWVRQLPADYVDQLADRASLSAQTIRKIVGVMMEEGSEQITSAELIAHLGITLRTANRYLSNLEKSGLAEPVGRKNAGGRGRPIVIYQLKLGIPVEPRE